MEEHDQGQQPDAIGAETAPVSAPGEGAPSSENQGSEQPVPTTEGGESFRPEEAADHQEEEAATAPSSEGEPTGVGGTGDHPAPAAMRDETGRLRVAGESPTVPMASGDAGAEIPDPEVGSGAMDEETRAKLNEPREPEQVETDRPDIGTPE